MERLKESTNDIHTVEIESTCKLHQVLSRYSLPSCLKVLRLNDNNLNFEDIPDLGECLKSVKSLHSLDLRRTTFNQCSFSVLLALIVHCKTLRSLSLTDNDLTEIEITNLITVFESMQNIKQLDLSKNNITETQANDILQKLKPGNNIAVLDLSHNALQGNKIIEAICQMQSLEEVNFAHNFITFSPLPDFEGGHDSLSINTKNISLSCNHMTPLDISTFCSLVRSNLLKLNLDFNHVGNSIWSLCALGLRIRNLKVLSLANSDVSGAVGGLAALLYCVGELEELNLSSNSLILADCQQLQIPLSNMSQLRRLNLSNNPDGIPTLLGKILPSLKNLEELRLSNTHVDCDDLKRISDSLASLKSIKYLELGMNAIGPDGIRTLANILKGFPLLEWLDLSRCFLQQDDVMVLCQCLVPLKKMKYLNLSLGDAWFLPSTLEELILSDVLHGEKLFEIMKFLHILRKLHLKNLKLRACDVEVLAAALLSFPKLEELSLSYIVAADSNSNKILSAMKSLGNLRKLHLTNLKLRACDVDALANTLSSFPKLEELSLPYIAVADSNLNKLFCAIKPLKNIKDIDLSGISLHNDIALSDMLSSLLCLEELVLSCMSVVDLDEKRLFGSIQLLKRLRKLDLGGINVRDSKALLDMLASLLLLEEIVFPAVVLGNIGGTLGYFGALVSLRYLKNVDLRWTKMCMSAKEGLARTLPSLQMLQRLVLEEKLGGDNEIYVALGNLKYLKEVDLGKSYITETGTAETLGRVLPSWTLLEKLVLHGIRYCDEYVEQLFAALANLKYLKELHLNFVGITEALVHVLPSLTLLEKLVLEEIISYDECDEQLFAALGNLKYLKELHLVRWNITESGTKTLAHVFRSLTLLEKLVLEGNSSYDDVKCDEQLFAALGNMKYLKQLHFVRWNITVNSGTETLGHVLPSLTLLEELVLKGNYSFVECDEQLFAALGNLKYVKEIDLECVYITESGIEALAHVLPSLTSLEKLVLKGIGSDDDECNEQLFAGLGNLKYLKEIDLEFVCSITEFDVEDLTNALPSLTLLEKLVLKGTRSVVECDEQLFAALGNLKYLKELRLVYVNFAESSIQALAHVLRSLTLLEKLVLEQIISYDECDEQLFAALGNLKYLKELHLVRWNITESGAKALVHVLPSLTLLEKLVLKGTRSVVECDEQLFAALGNLKHLKKLKLNGLRISQTGKEALAHLSPSLQVLKVVGLHWDSLEGDKRVFHALRGLRFLEELDLDGTDLKKIKITEAGVAALADVIPSLGLLKKLRLSWISFKDTSDDQLFAAVGSLGFLNELDLWFSKITQAGADSLTTTLPRLRNLRKFVPPWIENDEDRTLRKNLKGAASFVPDVFSYKYFRI